MYTYSTNNRVISCRSTDVEENKIFLHQGYTNICHVNLVSRIDDLDVGWIEIILDIVRWIEYSSLLHCSYLHRQR